MHLERLVLQNFRNYSQSTFDFPQQTILIVGPNTTGKTNIVEAMYLLSFGKSFRTEKDVQMIRFGEEVGRVQALIQNSKFKIQNDKEQEQSVGNIADNLKLEVMLAQGSVTGGRFTKKYLVNDVPKRRVDFEGMMSVVLFSPEELDIVTAGPALRRKLLDEVLEQTDREYRLAKSTYDRALRQRNALLQLVKETGKRNNEQFAYWDEVLIKNGSLVTQIRAAFVAFVNATKKDIFTFHMVYDSSSISEDRLQQYQNAEVGAGVTLVGPHRDDFLIFMDDREIKYFGSRGQQRLVVLQLKLLQLLFIEKELQAKPLLLLDDIFSELDEKNTQLVLAMVGKQQTIMTTASKRFLKEQHIKDVSVIELKKYA